ISRKLQPAERNWEVYDQELLAIVYAFKQWRHYAECAQYTVEVHSDHNNLRGIRAVQKLNPRQARWAVYLSGFDFDVIHRQGKKNPADGPSRRPDYFTENIEVIRWLPTLQNKLARVSLVGVESGARGPTTEEISGIADETSADRTCNAVLLNPVAGTVEYTQLVPRFEARVLLSETATGQSRPWTKLLYEAQQRCTFAQKQIAGLSTHERASRSGESHAWRLDENGLLRHKGRIYIPPEESIRQELLKSCHDHPMAGHFDARRTHELLTRSYHWQKMAIDAKEYVKTCAVCQRSKAPRHLPYGELSSLPIPSAPFEELTMDFITGLPPAKISGCVYDAILVVVDRYSKMVKYIPSRKDWTAKDLSEAFFKLICCSYWGVPKGIVSDRGTTFTSALWGELCIQLQIERRLSSAFHPQTDGQTERQNQTLEHYLRCYCSEEPEAWLDMLPLAEFAYNNTTHSTTRVSPFFLIQGRHPHMPKAIEDDRLGGEVPAEATRMKRMKNARMTLENRVKQAQEYQKRYYDKKHTAMGFKKGDMVLLSTRNLKPKQPSKKTTPKYVGPFKVRDAIGTQAYRLWLPTAYRIHDVFHISLLKPYHHRDGE
ncbi:MAG TPA: DDE-type integrase/transposase/recombinase, partial [Ktedonobacteraceae bacterium]|nr:DDE-type integrase/transposase/recombinase [Ktedonobacteraceae bacterium]